MEFIDHYELVEDAQGTHHIGTFLEALILAEGDPNRVWFVRYGDGCHCEDEDCECEDIWSVELENGQYVNHACYFVSTEPCKEEHRNVVFDY